MYHVQDCGGRLGGSVHLKARHAEWGEGGSSVLPPALGQGTQWGQPGAVHLKKRTDRVRSMGQRWQGNDIHLKPGRLGGEWGCSPEARQERQHPACHTVVLSGAVVEEEALQIGEGGSDHVGDLRVEVTATWHSLMLDADGQPGNAHRLQKGLQLA